MKERFIFLSLIAYPLFLTGCNDRVGNMEKIIADPNSFADYLMTFGGSLALVLILFSSLGVLRSILRSAQITGALAMAAGPLFYLQSQSIETALAVFLSGLIALGGATVIDLTTRRRPPDNDD